MRKNIGRLGSILESRNAAATGILLTLPFGVLFFGAINNIPPFNGMFTSGGVMDLLLEVFAGTSLLLLPVALALNVLAILKRRKGSDDVTGLTFNVALSITLSFFIVALIVEFLSGQ